MTSSNPITILTINNSAEYNRRRNVTKQKATMKSKFKRWIRNWLNEEQVEALSGSRLVDSTELDSNQPMRITIHRAAGGMVVETRTYDRLKDRNNQNLHIVTHEQNLGESLSKIVTMESLRG